MDYISFQAPTVKTYFFRVFHLKPLQRLVNKGGANFVRKAFVRTVQKMTLVRTMIRVDVTSNSISNSMARFLFLS